MVLLLLAAVVSIRVPRFDQPFGGITELWKVHHILGWGSLLLLMAHPLLLAFSRLTVSPQAAAAVLWPPRDALASWLGWAALLAMMAFLMPTFFVVGPRYYQVWKALHALSAAAVVFGIAHTLMLARTVPVWTWWALSGAAAVTLLYRLVWRKVRPGQRFTVSAVTPLTDDVVELSLVPEDGPMFKYLPGQFIYLSPLDRDIEAGYREEHPYTISSAPGEPVLRTGIKALGDASTALQQVQPGTRRMWMARTAVFSIPIRRAPNFGLAGASGSRLSWDAPGRWLRAIARAISTLFIARMKLTGRIIWKNLNRLPGRCRAFR
jgi:predicted ferric reductase